MKATLFATDEHHRLSNLGTVEMVYKNTDTPTREEKSQDVEYHLVNVHPEVEYQTFGGIGGAFTDTAAAVWEQAPQGKRDEIARAYYDRQAGIGYSFARLCIGSCDYSVGDYVYVQEGDRTLSTFDLSHDINHVFPMVHAAQKYAEIRFLASPWSPPAYMKTNGARIGGKLKPEFYPLWAKHFRKYVEVCKACGIDIWGVTMQNEPRHHQIWESCQYTPDEEAAFLNFLGSEMEGSGVKLLCYDHCRERVLERADSIFGSVGGAYCDGIAHHWYSGTHFGELRAFRQRYPDKLSVASEGCCSLIHMGNPDAHDRAFAEKYAHDICGCFNNGVNCYCDWNLLLDGKNGPYHNRDGRGVDAVAPVSFDCETGELSYKLSYYYIGHYSKFVSPGARVVASSAYDSDVETVAFKNPDGTVAVVLLNRTDHDLPCILRMSDCVTETLLTAHSIMTALIMP